MTQPSSSPRRWPDLLIGLLVVLLLLGFALLLLRPGGRAPAAETPGAPATTAEAPADAAETPGAQTPTDDIPAAPSAQDPGEAATLPEAPASAPNAPASGPDPATEPPTIAASPVTPSGEATAEPAAGAETPDEQAGATPPVGAGAPAQSATSGDQPSTAAPRSGGAVATSEQRTPLRSDYRISLGTFASESAARSAAGAVSALGYTVYPIDLGDQVVAQVGPFADEGAARQALADIVRAYPRAVLYPPRGRSLGGASPAAGVAAPSDPPEAAPAAAVPAPSGPTYLQVGAFDRVESAQRLVGQLRDLGYAPTVNAPDGGKVTVLVGPYTGDALTRTEARLDANGLDNFRVR